MCFGHCEVSTRLLIDRPFMRYNYPRLEWAAAPVLSG